MDKIGRNDPCPCGSGKKYKKCCLNITRQVNDEFLRQQVRQIESKMTDILAYFVKKQFGSEVLHLAWQDYTNDANARFSDDNPHIQLVLPWFFYNWLPGLNKKNLKIPINKVGFTIADLYLDKYSNRLSSPERMFVEQALRQPYSYYEVTEVQPDHGMTLKNMLWNETVFVREKSATQELDPGVFIYCRIIEFQGINLMLGCSSIRIPRHKKINILNFKETILKEDKTITKKSILKWQDWLNGSYLDLYNQVMTIPKMVNKDGDELVFCDLKYKIDNPLEAWNSLKHLGDLTEDEFRETEEFDENGNLQKIEFAWLCELLPGELNPSVFAQLTIAENELLISVNSKKREKKVRSAIKKLLADKAEFLTSTIRSIDSVMKDDSIKPNQDDPDMVLSENPEIIQLLENYFANHWKNWIDEKIPALGNKTPRQAVRTKIGKEKVLALLEDNEYSSTIDPHMAVQLKFIKNVRKELGLD